MALSTAWPWPLPWLHQSPSLGRTSCPSQLKEDVFPVPKGLPVRQSHTSVWLLGTKWPLMQGNGLAGARRVRSQAKG